MLGYSYLDVEINEFGNLEFTVKTVEIVDSESEIVKNFLKKDVDGLE